MLFSHSLSSIFPPGSSRCPLTLSPLYSSSVFICCFPLVATISVSSFFPTCIERIYRCQCKLAQVCALQYTLSAFICCASTFFAEYTDKLDICSLFQIVFHTHAGISMRTTEKAKILLGAAFYFQFVFICPSAPHGCLWERVSTCFIGRYCVSGSKSVFTHRCESRTSVSVPLLFV